MKPMGIRFFLLLTVIMATAWPAAGDTIRMTTGRAIEGIIVEENDEAVVLDIGVGTTTIRRHRIQSIERGDAGETSKIEKQWEEKYYTHKRHVPEQFQALASEFQRLTDRRAAARRSQRSIEAMKAAEDRLQRELNALHRALGAMSSQLHQESQGKRDTAEAVSRYNTLVASNNFLGIRLREKRRGAEGNRTKLDGGYASLVSYNESLAAFRTQFDTAKRALVDDAEAEERARKYLARLEEHLSEYGGDFTSYEIRTARHGKSVVLNVILNGRVSARFLFDTGASTVTLSSELAARLGISGNPEHVMPVYVADGRTVEAIPVLLDSVNAGGAIVRRVPAMIMPKAPGPQIDGLLGMTFLREFDIRFDPARRKLILTRFGK